MIDQHLLNIWWKENRSFLTRDELLFLRLAQKQVQN